MFNLGEISMMKKSLVALAALAATGAFAQSAVTMYGVVEATVDLGYKATASQYSNTYNGAGVFTPGPVYSAQSTTKDAFRVQDGNSQGVGTSRIGWRGTEDLGGGMKANFQLEMGLRVDDGCTTSSPIALTGVAASGAVAGTASAGCTNSGDSGGNTFGRNAWVGASGGFGEVRLGRQVLGSFGVQANSWADGSSNGLYSPGAAVSAAMGGVRFANSIKYISPNLSGFTGQVAIRAPEGNTETRTAALNPKVVNTKNKIGFDLALEYANGPIYVGLGLNKTKNYKVTDSAVGSVGNSVTTEGAATVNLPALAPGVAVAGVSSVTGTTIGASYNFGVVQPFFNHTRQKSDVTNSTANSTSLTTTNGAIKHNATTFGLKAPFGPVTLITSYGFGKINADTSDVVSPTVGRIGTDSAVVKLKALNIGAQYALSKRTMLEANYGQLKTTHQYNGTDFAPVTGVNLGGVQVNYNAKVSALNVGVRHSF
jgi:predicted porin